MTEKEDPKKAKEPPKKAVPLPMLLYKCPGEHPGGRLASYDCKHAKTQEDADKLADEGWSESHLEADARYKAEKAKAAPDAAKK